MSATYVLGTAAEELDRLGLQHQVWHAHTTELWARAGFAPGQHLLDAGCGPGFATADLAHLVGREGRVTAVDAAQSYTDATRQRCAALGLAQVETVTGDLHDVALPERCDGVFLRWVLSFVADPAAIVARLAAALRPGGALVAMDYLHYRSAKMFPASDVLDELFAHFERSNRRRGGDYDRGGALPGWLERSGLRIEHLRPLVHAARPGDRYWLWFTSFCRVFLPSMVESGEVSESFAVAVVECLRERERDPAAFLFTPPVLAAIARHEAPDQARSRTC